MTGTAEMKPPSFRFYKIGVLVIPTTKPVARADATIQL